MTMLHLASSRPKDDGSYAAGHQRAVDSFGSTADYHSSLLDQQRQAQSGHKSPVSHRPSSSQATNTSSPLRQWLQLPGNKKTACPTCPRPWKKEKKSQRRPPLTRDVAPLPHRELSRQELDEFEALPIAIRRKYFSTLERLRIAQTSGILGREVGDGAHCWNRIPLAAQPLTNHFVERPTTSPAVQRHREDSLEPLSLAKLPAKIREKHLTREEQLLVAKQLRESVILDAADEAIYKLGRRASRHLSPPLYTPTLSSSDRPSMDSVPSEKPASGLDEPRDAFYDSFRWLDEDDDLDLRLALDDYHVDMTEPLPLVGNSRPPSHFRRRLSMSKRPFGRSSASSSRPATKDSPSAPMPDPLTYAPPVRRRSRALSLRTAKHALQESVSSIDPEAAHYQDPEARLKLRVYLASPQKFDEAIEFGFPSHEVRSGSRKGSLSAPGGHASRVLSNDPESFKTFLSDDKSSTHSQPISISDPDSPRTPHTPEKPHGTGKALSLFKAGAPPPPARVTDGYAQASTASREMTLRMTLTRRDLRANEEQMYGRQQQDPRASQSRASRDYGLTARASAIGDPTKENMDRIFSNIDQQLGSSQDGRGLRRFWNRVRRN